jgi:hypothetical protein
VLSSVPDVPTGYPGFSAVMNGPATTKLRGEINAYEFMRAAKCAGSAAIFTLPFPVLKLSTNAFTTTVKANCPKCSVSYNEVQTKDIGTPAAVTAVVSKLQSDPKVKYLYTIIANLATGMDTALSQAGITGVSIFGQTPDENSIKALRAKTNTWWVGLTPQVTGWSEFYLGLRAIDTGAAVQDTAAIPQTVLTQDNVPAGAGVPALPADYVEEFTKLYQGA